MASVVYMLCGATALTCALLLLRAYRQSGTRLLLWSSLCFAFLALNNGLLTIDLLVLPQFDLFALRNATALAGVCMLLYGLIWETQ